MSQPSEPSGITSPPNRQKLLSSINDRLLDHYLALDDNGKFLHPPANDRELDEFIQLFYNVKLPKKRIDPNHRAPFELIADLFFERVKNALGFANRNGGKTMSIAILNHLDMMFKPGCEVASAGAVLDQANKCYSYFTSFLELPRFKKLADEYFKKTGRSLVVKSIQSYTRLDTGSEQQILTGTDRGLRSPHPNKARIDEIDLMEWRVLQTGLSMAKSSSDSSGKIKIRGQNVFTSTRQMEDGPMQRMLDTAEAKGITVYEWNIWEVLQRCTRRCVDDPVHGSCPIFVFCKGKAHHCDGFYAVDDFIDKVRVLDQNTFETEWLNLKPARNKLVYHMVDRSAHIMTPKKLFEMTGFSSFQPFWPRTSGLDFGSSPGHPFVYIKCIQLPKGQWVAFYEYVREQALLRDHAKAIQQSPLYLFGDPLYSDHDLQDRVELQALGIRTKPAQKDVLTGIDYLSTLFSGFPLHDRFEPQLYIWHELEHTLSEANKYSWPVLPDGKPDRSGLPIKRYDNCLDALRYALFSHRGPKQSSYRSYTLPGI